MPEIARVGDYCTGHACWPSRRAIEGSPDVFANGIAVNRVGDHWAVHCCQGSCHDGVLSDGAPTGFGNGIKVGRIGDPISCGSYVATGSPDSFIGPGGATDPVPPLTFLKRAVAGIARAGDRLLAISRPPGGGILDPDLVDDGF